MRRLACSGLLFLGLVCPRASAAADRLGPLERIAGWRVLLDETRLKDWEIKEGDVRVEPPWVIPASESVRLWCRERFADFELRAAVRDDVWCGLLYVRAIGGEIEVFGPERESGSRPVPSGAVIEAGPILIERAETGDKPWRVGLRSTGGGASKLASDAFRDVIVREWDAPRRAPAALFDDKTTTGWSVKQGSVLRVENGELVVEAEHAESLVVQRVLGDFRLECDVLVSEGATWGLRLRGDEGGAAAGFMSTFERTDLAGMPRKSAELAWEQVRSRAGWKHLRIECVGPWFRTWLDRCPGVDRLIPVEPSGVLSFELLSKGALRLRNVAIDDWGTQVWKPLAVDRPARPSGPGRGMIVSRETWTEGTFRVVAPAGIEDLVAAVRVDRLGSWPVEASSSIGGGQFVLDTNGGGYLRADFSLASARETPRALLVSSYTLGWAAAFDGRVLSSSRGGCSVVGDSGGSIIVESMDEAALRKCEVFVLSSSRN